MAKREFLMLAHTYDQIKHGIAGWFMSEKLDGMRCYWDGGLSRGLPKSHIPWANTEKDERYISEPMATGLWSRYGNVIHAPDWWLDELPHVPLDGELYLIGGPRQELMSIVKALQPGEGWKDVRYYAFDEPSFDTIFTNGRIDTTNFKIALKGVRDWVYENMDISSLDYIPKSTTPFATTYSLLKLHCDDNPVVSAHKQVRLPFSTDAAVDLVDQYCTEISIAGGEGLVLRKPESTWVAYRTYNLLKVKKFSDSEGTVVGYVTGRKTDLGSKLLGKMGALILRLDNSDKLELSGFTDAERELYDINDPESKGAEEWATENPGQECPDWIAAVRFPRGSRITFKYRGVSRDGIPQEARYWRHRLEE